MEIRCDQRRRESQEDEVKGEIESRLGLVCCQAEAMRKAVHDISIATSS